MLDKKKIHNKKTKIQNAPNVGIGRNVLLKHLVQDDGPRVCITPPTPKSISSLPVPALPPYALDETHKGRRLMMRAVYISFLFFRCFHAGGLMWWFHTTRLSDNTRTRRVQYNVYTMKLDDYFRRCDVVGVVGCRDVVIIVVHDTMSSS